MAYETEKIEFKSVVTSEIYKEVIAFANTDGGELIIGINDNGDIEPLSGIDDVYTRLTNGIRDAIVPDITLFVKYKLESNQTIRISVNEGTYKPYYLKSKGLKPSGVYVRQGASSVPASPDAIRKMIKESDGDIFEEFPAINQNLTFTQCKESFSKRGIEFNEGKFEVLGIFDRSRQAFTNLGWLLSDQCEHSIKVAVFEDANNTVFKGRKEFSGSILKQIDEAFDYIELSNNIQSNIKGLIREDFPDYPTEALREALLNAVIHRNYEYSASIIVNINREFMEFISIGGLLPGLTQAEILNGISALRNKKLANIFARLKIIEAYGTGIRRIFGLYENSPETPQIHVTDNSFKLIMPNMNTSRISQTTTAPLTKQEKLILSYLEQYEEATDEKIQELLDVKKTRAFVITKEMADKGLIRISGRGESRRITL